MAHWILVLIGVQGQPQECKSNVDENYTFHISIPICMYDIKAVILDWEVGGKNIR